MTCRSLNFYVTCNAQVPLVSSCELSLSGRADQLKPHHVSRSKSLTQRQPPQLPGQCQTLPTSLVSARPSLPPWSVPDHSHLPHLPGLCQTTPTPLPSAWPQPLLCPSPNYWTGSPCPVYLSPQANIHSTDRPRPRDLQDHIAPRSQPSQQHG